jgi:hypothetical protein
VHPVLSTHDAKILEISVFQPFILGRQQVLDDVFK